MEWALTVLFCAAILLLILSYVKTKQVSKKADREMEEVSFTFMDELTKLQQQIRNLEIDAEIRDLEDGITESTSKHRLLLREVLDLHKRGYSNESIAMKIRLTPNEVEKLLIPFTENRSERRKVANDF